MGNKSEAFITKISSLSEKCTGPMFALEEGLRQQKVILDQHADVMWQHDERVRILDPGTTGGEQNDRAIANDSKCQQLEKQMDVFCAKALSLKTGTKKAAENLKAVAIPFRDELGKFETFIEKKAKSKNPFKSKKSLPGSRNFIKGGNAALKTIRELLAAVK